MTGVKYGLLSADDEFLHGGPDLKWIKSIQATTPGSQIVVKREDGRWHDYEGATNERMGN